MRQLILQMGVSIDGYVAALDGSHPWGYASEDEATKRWKLESVYGAGAHLMGRVTYEDMAAFWPIQERLCASDERDPQDRLLENPATRRLARHTNRPRRPQQRDSASQARARQRPDRPRRRLWGFGSALEARASALVHFTLVPSTLLRWLEGRRVSHGRCVAAVATP
jgi:hypothetical protein